MRLGVILFRVRWIKLLLNTYISAIGVVDFRVYELNIKGYRNKKY